MWINKDKLRDMIDDGIEEYFVLSTRIEQMIKSGVGDKIVESGITTDIENLELKVDDWSEKIRKDYTRSYNELLGTIDARLRNIIGTEEWIDALIERIKRKQIK